MSGEEEEEEERYYFNYKLSFVILRKIKMRETKIKK